MNNAHVQKVAVTGADPASCAAATCIESAADRMLGEIEALLARVSLPIAGLRDQFPAHYVVATVGGDLIGCAGLETYGGVALLRSVAVAAPYQRSGIGGALVANRLGAANAQRLGAVYLLTTTAADYFSRLGFAPVDRARVPPQLAASPEFAEACPRSASCLSIVL